jgi:tripartite-type tricarboxylate transporter receptor subunit TctC
MMANWLGSRWRRSSEFSGRRRHRRRSIRLNDAIVDALADRTLRSRFADLGLEIPPREEQTPEALAALQKAEIEKWWPIIRAAGVKTE